MLGVYLQLSSETLCPSRGQGEATLKRYDAEEVKNLVTVQLMNGCECLRSWILGFLM